MIINQSSVTLYNEVQQRNFCTFRDSNECIACTHAATILASKLLQNYKSVCRIAEIIMKIKVSLPTAGILQNNCKKTLQFTMPFKDDIRHRAGLKQQI